MGGVERWRRLRDRMLASPRFRRWATAFPLTRLVARRHARAAFDLCAGFVYSQILLACVQLELLELLADGALSVERIAVRLDLTPAAAERLLRAAAALDLVQRRGDGYGLGPLGATLAGDQGIAAMVRHHALLYADLADPVALLRGERAATALGGYWAYAGNKRPDSLAAEAVAAYTSLMSASQPLVAGEVLDAYPLQRHRCLLDVGGGDGTFVTAVAARCPDMRLMLFDLPAVAARAQARFEAAGIADRAEACGGDFTRDALPAGADLVSLVRVVHDHDDDVVGLILRRAREALPADGTLLIAEPLAETSGARPIGDAYFGFYLLAMGKGRPRRFDEIAAMLQAAGFGTVRRVPTRTPMLASVITARPTGQNRPQP